MLVSSPTESASRRRVFEPVTMIVSTVAASEASAGGAAGAVWATACPEVPVRSARTEALR